MGYLCLEIWANIKLRMEKTEYSQGTIYCDKVLRHLMPQENGNNGHV